MDDVEKPVEEMAEEKFDQLPRDVQEEYLTWGRYPPHLVKPLTRCNAEQVAAAVGVQLGRERFHGERLRNGYDIIPLPGGRKERERRLRSAVVAACADAGVQAAFAPPTPRLAATYARSGDGGWHVWLEIGPYDDPVEAVTWNVTDGGNVQRVQVRAQAVYEALIGDF